MAIKKRISIADFKFTPQKFVNFYDYWTGRKIEVINRYSDGSHRMRSDDLIDSNYYISGKVTAHFTFPIHPSDSSYGRWKRYEQNFMYSDVQNYNRDLFNGSADIIFIDDGTDGIAVVGAQFYGKSYVDNAREIPTKKIINVQDEQVIQDLTETINTPPGVDSGYIPHRYHVQIGDTIELYSGQLIHLNWFDENPQYENSKAEDGINPFIEQYSKRYISLVNSTIAYTVIPNETYVSKEKISSTNKIIDDIYEKNIEIKKSFAIPKRITITIASRNEGRLVRIKGVKLAKYLKSNSSKQQSNLIKLMPGKLYTVEDRYGNEIDFRICHGTEMAKFFTSMPFDREFDLVGILAGTDAYGVYEIWPRTMYDLGLPQPTNIDPGEYLGNEETQS